MGKKWDFKNSPAMGHLKKAGKAAVDYLGLSDQPSGRNDHFDHGSTEHLTKEHHVLNEDVAADQNFEDRGLGVGSIGNITSIRDAYDIRARKAERKPEGY